MSKNYAFYLKNPLKIVFIEHTCLKEKKLTEDKNKPAFTFDDISLVPSYSEVLPSETDVSVRLCDRLVLTMPIISAACQPSGVRTPSSP